MKIERRKSVSFVSNFTKSFFPLHLSDVFFSHSSFNSRLIPISLSLSLSILTSFSHSFFFVKLPSWFAQASYLATFIAYSNSAVNPIIYGGFNQGFRDALINVFKCRSNETASNVAALMRTQPTSRTMVGSTVNYTISGRTGRRIQENFVSELVEMKTIQVDEDEDQNETNLSLPINQTR